MNREIILFGKDFAAPPIADVNALGRKAADLAQMAIAGINVPASAVLPVGLIDHFLNRPSETKAWLKANIDAVLQRFGVADETLLAVRLSPVQAVPGLGQTVLGLGQTAEGFAAHSRLYSEEFAWRKRREMIVLVLRFLRNF
jgi:phosphoenolpyruvate synthase/pyruvate phosphate dikinase